MFRCVFLYEEFRFPRDQHAVQGGLFDGEPVAFCPGRSKSPELVADLAQLGALAHMATLPIRRIRKRCLGLVEPGSESTVGLRPPSARTVVAGTGWLNVEAVPGTVRDDGSGDGPGEG